MKLKTLMLGLFFSCVSQAQDLSGVLTFHGAIVQAPCNIQVTNEMMTSICLVDKSLVEQNVLISNVVDSEKKLLMYKLTLEKIKQDKNAMVLHMSYM